MAHLARSPVILVLALAFTMFSYTPVFAFPQKSPLSQLNAAAADLPAPLDDPPSDPPAPGTHKTPGSYRPQPYTTCVTKQGVSACATGTTFIAIITETLTTVLRFTETQLHTGGARTWTDVSVMSTTETPGYTPPSSMATETKPISTSSATDVSAVGSTEKSSQSTHTSAHQSSTHISAQQTSVHHTQTSTKPKESKLTPTSLSAVSPVNGTTASSHHQKHSQTKSNEVYPSQTPPAYGTIMSGKFNTHQSHTSTKSEEHKLHSTLSKVGPRPHHTTQPHYTSENCTSKTHQSPGSHTSTRPEEHKPHSAASKLGPKHTSKPHHASDNCTKTTPIADSKTTKALLPTETIMESPFFLHGNLTCLRLPPLPPVPVVTGGPVHPHQCEGVEGAVMSWPVAHPPGAWMVMHCGKPHHPEPKSSPPVLPGPEKTMASPPKYCSMPNSTNFESCVVKMPHTQHGQLIGPEQTHLPNTPSAT